MCLVSICDAHHFLACTHASRSCLYPGELPLPGSTLAFAPCTIAQPCVPPLQSLLTDQDNSECIRPYSASPLSGLIVSGALCCRAVRTLAPDRSHLANQLASTSSSSSQSNTQYRAIEDMRRSLNERLAIVSRGPQHAEAVDAQRGQLSQKANGKGAWPDFVFLLA